MTENEYGENELTAEVILSSTPEFEKATRRERNYKADAVDAYIDTVLSTLQKEYDDRQQAQDALNRTKKKLEESETRVNDLQLQYQSNGKYIATDINRRITPFSEVQDEETAFDSDAWSENLSDTQLRNKNLQEENVVLREELEELKIRLAKIDNKEYLVSSLPKDGRERPAHVVNEPKEEEEDLFSFDNEEEASSNNENTDDTEFGLENPTEEPYAEDEVEEEPEVLDAPAAVVEASEEPVQQPRSALYSQSEPEFIQNGQVVLSEVDKASVLIRQAAEVAEVHLKSAKAEADKTLTEAYQTADNIRREAEKVAEQFITDSQQTAENAESIIEDAKEVVKQFISQHENQKRDLRDFLVSLDERGRNSFQVVDSSSHVSTTNSPEDDENIIVKPNDEDFATDI